MNGWQPIETAPKDGTAILGYFPAGRGQGVFLANLFHFDAEVMETAYHHGWDRYGAGPNPTHWMLLPDRPTR